MNSLLANPNIEDAHECEHSNPNDVLKLNSFGHATVQLFKWRDWPNWCVEIDGLPDDNSLSLDVAFCPFCGEKLQEKLILID